VVGFGGAGVVAFAAAVIATIDGAKAILVGYDGPERVRRLTMEANDRFDVDLGYADGTTEEQKAELAKEADLVFSAGPAGRQILSLDQIKQSKNLKVAADVNAVPPLGVEGVGIKDKGTPIEGTDAVGIGALAIGDVKYKTESGLFKEMIEAEKPVYLDFRAAYRLAQDLVS
jgi:methylene-tetrahydromethanopterin dehydrogenase